MPIRTGKQTGLLVLGIIKLLGAVIFFGFGILMLVGGSSPEFIDGFIQGFEEAGGEGLLASDVETVIRTAGVAFAVIGLGGIAHGALDLVGAKAGNTATAAGVFGVLGCLLDVVLVVFSGILALPMLALNIAQTVLAFMVTSEASNPPMGGYPPQGGYPGYGQPGMPQQGYPQQGGYGQNGGYGGY